MMRPERHKHRGSRKQYDFYLAEEADAIFTDLETRLARYEGKDDDNSKKSSETDGESRSNGDPNDSGDRGAGGGDGQASTD